MTFWIISGVIGLMAVAAIVLTMRRGRGLSTRINDPLEIELGVYRDQLKEVDRDLARGTVSKEDAQRIRVEVSRRMLDADRNARKAGANKTTPVLVALIVGAIVLGGAVGLYSVIGAPGYLDLPLERRISLANETRMTRPTQAEAEADMPPAPPIEAEPEHLQLLDKLRMALETRGDDLQGWQLLARNELNLGRFADAYHAQERIIAIKGVNATADDYADLAEMKILAAGGYVSPEAETALTHALQRDREHPIATYYSGLMFAQTGRPDLTFRLWRPLLDRSNADDPWVMPIRSRIEEVADAAGVRYSLPPLDALSGPSQDDINAASDMTAEERMDMIRSMVDGLSARLANSGGTPAEWARLISSLGVLGDTERARAIWGEAQVTFGGNPDALAQVRAAAESAGVAQ